MRYLMRHTKWFLPMTVVVALGLFGCGKSNPDKPAPKSSTPATATEGAAATDAAPAAPVFDASKLQAAFGADNVTISDAVGMIKDKDYPGALKMMQSLAKNPKLTPAKKQAVDETITWLQNASGSN